jgi:hypothetical protein
MHCKSSLRHFLLLALFSLFAAVDTSGQITDDFASAFAVGREYFVLRSGNAKLILQSDKVGVQPAVTYMLFDADRPCQTLRKGRAFNYTPGRGCWSSALEVVMRGVPFTALPHVTDVHWTNEDGIPSVVAHWWAGGIRVTETFTALEGTNAFVRKITLTGKDLAGPGTARLRLSLPPGRYFSREGMLVGIAENVALGIRFIDQISSVVDVQNGSLESAPIPVRPGGSITVTSLLATSIPAAGYSYEQKCGDDEPVPPSMLRPGKQAGVAIGLKAEYFNNPDLRGTPAVVRIDTNFCPYWGGGSPAAGVNADSFSVRWTGSLVPFRSGRYRFNVAADERARLYIGDTVLISCSENSRNVRVSGDITLEKGKSYDIRIDYAELLGWAGIRVRCLVPGPAPEETAVEAGVEKMFAAMESMRISRTAGEFVRTRAYWKQTSSMDTKDPLVKEIYDNARFALPGMIGTIGKMDAGMFEYGDQWVRDGSNFALGLIHAGHFEAAKVLLSHVLIDLLSTQGALISSGAFDDPDREEFDQMGVLLHALRAYRDWTGDSLLIAEHRTKLIAMIERPLEARFRDSTGMVHNRREYWERTFDEGYELAYQTFMVSGLRDAAELSGLLAVPEKATYWRSEADVFLRAMLNHPSRSLVQEGRLIKRRNLDGTVADFVPSQPSDNKRDDPEATEAFHWLNPDASSVLPMLFGVVDPKSTLARNTLDRLEEIWNARWDFGGYERYHSSSQQDQPGPWCFATAFITRAQHDAGMYDRSRRSLDWLLHIEGGNSGAWLEEIPLIRSQVPAAGIVVWASAEVVLFTVRHWLGISFEGGSMIVHPALFAGQGGCKADLRFRSSRLKIEVDKAGEVDYAIVNGKKILPRKDGAVEIPWGELKGDLDIRVVARN